MKKYVINPNICTSCGTCQDNCPTTGAIDTNDKGEYVIDPTVCIGCGTCKGICPSGAITVVDYDSKTINFDVNKFLTYENFLKSIYDTMGGNLYQHIQM